MSGALNHQRHIALPPAISGHLFERVAIAAPFFIEANKSRIVAAVEAEEAALLHHFFEIAKTEGVA
jgi:hypothetical protein